MLLYLIFFSGITFFILLRGLIYLSIQLVIRPVYAVRSVQTAGYISDSYIKTKRLIWLKGIEEPIKIGVWVHPHEGDHCLSKEYWLGSKLLYAKVVCLAHRETGELNYF